MHPRPHPRHVLLTSTSSHTVDQLLSSKGVLHYLSLLINLPTDSDAGPERVPLLFHISNSKQTANWLYCNGKLDSFLDKEKEKRQAKLDEAIALLCKKQEETKKKKKDQLRTLKRSSKYKTESEISQLMEEINLKVEEEKAAVVICTLVSWHTLLCTVGGNNFFLCY